MLLGALSNEVLDKLLLLWGRSLDGRVSLLSSPRLWDNDENDSTDGGEGQVVRRHGSSEDFVSGSHCGEVTIDAGDFSID